MKKINFQVPFNFEAIQREHASRSHLPINLNLPPMSTPPTVAADNRKDLETKPEDDADEKSRRKPTVTRCRSYKTPFLAENNRTN
jgi:hypothetical protein